MDAFGNINFFLLNITSTMRMVLKMEISKIKKEEAWIYAEN
jgi:hypothetical protein